MRYPTSTTMRHPPMRRLLHAQQAATRPRYQDILPNRPVKRPLHRLRRPTPSSTLDPSPERTGETAPASVVPYWDARASLQPDPRIRSGDRGGCHWSDPENVIAARTDRGDELGRRSNQGSRSPRPPKTAVTGRDLSTTIRKKDEPTAWSGAGPGPWLAETMPGRRAGAGPGRRGGPYAAPRQRPWQARTGPVGAPWYPRHRARPWTGAGPAPGFRCRVRATTRPAAYDRPGAGRGAAAPAVRLSRRN